MNKRIISIVGARPNFIKSKVISDQLRSQRVEEVLIHTGQHYDFHLSQTFFEGLNLKKPDINLGVGSREAGEQIALMIIGIEKAVLKIKPNAIIIYGDTNSTLAVAIAASKHFIPLIHIEAGERSYDDKSPEEVNRIICDRVSKINCCATKNALNNLKKENLRTSAYFTGDIMLDVFLQNIEKAESLEEKVPKNFILFTLHRAENTNNRKKLRAILQSLGNINRQMVWPIHPRTKKLLRIYRIKLPNNFLIIPPVSYKHHLWLEKNSKRIITDSGGVQKEAYWLKKPCITLLNKTGWTDTLVGSWNQLVLENYDNINVMLSKKVTGKPNIHKFGDGHAAEKTVKIIRSIF